jgi:carboxymethylenebutenolidase
MTNTTPRAAAQRRETLKAGDGHLIEAYVAMPSAAPAVGAVVLLQEIFGLNTHMQQEADHWAAQGYVAIAPALFDRVERALVLGYDEVQRGLACVGAITEDMLVADVQAAIDAAAARLAEAKAAGGRVSVVGWCWGGAVAFLAASRCHGLHRAACYYGTRIASFCERMKPAVPTIYHFGELDKSLPPQAIDKIRAADPAGTFHVYAGVDHAFTNHERPSYDAAAASLAHRRTREFIG